MARSSILFLHSVLLSLAGLASATESPLTEDAAQDLLHVQGILRQVLADPDLDPRVRTYATRQFHRRHAATARRLAGERTKGGDRCDHYRWLRRPFYGDLHVHTNLSMDTIYFGGGLDHGPTEAYRFARGEPLGLPPFDPLGNPSATAQLERPLDFAAVTDHAEFFGEVRICFTASHPAFDSAECTALRQQTPAAAAPIWFSQLLVPDPPGPLRFATCADEEPGCLEVAETVWQEVQQAAEEAYDRSSACTFTTFNGYEWSGTTGGANLHRNVLFAGDVVPELPISYLDAPQAEELWDALERDCLDAGTGCDALAIPHNSNTSLGRMFLPENADGTAFELDDAARRAALEPLVEVIQHKGASECRPGLDSVDELCDFNLWRTPLALPPPPGAPPPPPFAPTSFARNALKLGLLEEERLGVNPFPLGFVGGTDTHNSTPGLVSESDFNGHLASLDAPLPARLAFPNASPGGLTVAWAEENRRAAIFAALKRREVYATSGPRLVVRLFGGFFYPDYLCRTPLFDLAGYLLGEPMGGRLDVPGFVAAHRAPKFAVAALRDPGTPSREGVALQHIQIIKGWVENGTAHEVVYDVAGDPDNGAGVDPATGEPIGPGFDTLCEVWTDPNFDPQQPAFYYARVLENPSEAWSARQCRTAGVDCAVPSSITPGLEACCAPQTERIIQERAWTSPIWYSPQP
ncbi:MAG: DUF3604 domain-containing protein [Acidobacteriota bacterium]